MGQKIQELIGTAKTGALLMLLLGAMKTATGVVSGSVALTADGVNTLAYVFVMVSAWIQLRVVGREDRAGGREEFSGFRDLSGSFVAILLVFMAIQLFGEFIVKWNSPQIIAAPDLALAVSLSSAVVMYYLGTTFRMAAERNKSRSLKAEAKNLFLSAIISGVVAASLIAYAFGYDVPELVVALFVTLHILRAGGMLARDVVLSSLGLDAEPRSVAQIKRRVVEVEGVMVLERVSVRRFGEFFFAEIVVRAVKMSTKKRDALRHHITNLLNDECKMDCAAVQIK